MVKWVDKTKYRLFALFLLLLFIVDAIITYIGVNFHGLTELNPVMSYFVHSLNLLILIKIIGFLMIYILTPKNKKGIYIYSFMIIIYVIVLINNFSLVLIK
jgi:hypothetical protein